MKNFPVTLMILFTGFLAFVAPSCQRSSDPLPVVPSVQITIRNVGFEEHLDDWKIETAYTGRWGFQSDTGARRTGSFGLNFYAAQTAHFANAPQETPWNGKIYQTVTGLKDGTYTFKAYADATGTGMYLWANGGVSDTKVLIKSPNNELNTLDFVVKGGIAKFGFICIDAGGDASILAPYFHADDVELWTK